ncbi:MAG: hypothetical protein M5U34_32105, partial [Chloroflexi bacterium]|nr:hypothetical protein [Chloroflexota bacterium]
SGIAKVNLLTGTQDSAPAAIDREALAEALYGNRAVEMRHLAPPGVFGGAAHEMPVGVGCNPELARQKLVESGLSAAAWCPILPSWLARWTCHCCKRR